MFMIFVAKLPRNVVVDNGRHCLCAAFYFRLLPALALALIRIAPPQQKRYFAFLVMDAIVMMSRELDIWT